MPNFCANLGFLFTELPFLDRFAASAKARFLAVEYSAPYDYQISQLVEKLCENNLQQALINMPAGNWAAGERGIACHPDRKTEFQEGVGQAIDYALALGCPVINCLAGLKPPTVSTDAAWDTLIDNLRFAGKHLHQAGLTLVVEPINTIDMPGFFLNTSARAIEALDATGDSHIKLQYDIYHMQRMEGALSETITRLFSRIGHFQCAGVPGRTEPDQGEINYASVFDLIDRLGYTGWIGAEYKPVTSTLAGLQWLHTMGRRSL
jgi:hydroxypyruvate isomerase